MATVEELKHKIDKEVFKTLLIMQTTPGDRDKRRREVFSDLLDLTDAARAEGAAEERERIRGSAHLIRSEHPADASDCFSKVMKGGEWQVVADEDCLVIPASALAPEENP